MQKFKSNVRFVERKQLFDNQNLLQTALLIATEPKLKQIRNKLNLFDDSVLNEIKQFCDENTQKQIEDIINNKVNKIEQCILEEQQYLIRFNEQWEALRKLYNLFTEENYKINMYLNKIDKINELEKYEEQLNNQSIENALNELSKALIDTRNGFEAENVKGNVETDIEKYQVYAEIAKIL
ncbi:Hypothetical_protein [Hexamita inflata]|uniref:Hypothetical_protein n=1 Tax=Hexamita inflata TaxID=28002 RepID=A0AA86U3A7_9EUKA|nr:Hypothetical protein HINF_LOCUS25876 [Hexamita inflata]